MFVVVSSSTKMTCKGEYLKKFISTDCKGSYFFATVQILSYPFSLFELVTQRLSKKAAHLDSLLSLSNCYDYLITAPLALY